MTFQQLFGKSKPVIGMLHLKSDGKKTALERAREETWIYEKYGVDAVLVENYFGSAKDCEDVLAWLSQKNGRMPYGVNILGDYREAFRLARKYGASFIQIDSVCGHLPPYLDDSFAQELEELRSGCSAVLLGGVRFKYQPVLSGRTEQEDLQLGMKRCDAIVVTGTGTGIETPQKKIDDFRRHLGNFPLIVGAGCTLDTVQETFANSDGAIIGSYFKDGHDAFGDLNRNYVDAYMKKKHLCCATDTRL